MARRHPGQGAELLRTPLDIEVSQASRSAIKAVEDKGGKIECAYYNKVALRAHLKARA